ncbi:MAG: NAD-dependent epimerase/dehydratase family protein [Candidatus Caenarcaniphilales bacterium]|nr:NAD-dependent epimerase/dehydratase family protein [Candidatus Caenarcaniphilales bacterium]
MNSQSVLLTGLTSFTGAYIARALLDGGYKVVCPLRAKKESYDGIKKHRLELALKAKIIDSVDISSSQIVDLCVEIKPQVFINHGGYIENYRSDDFNVLKHLETNLQQVQPLIKTLKENGCKLFIHSGSAFEPGEEYSKYGLVPYGVAKKMVWDLTLFWCHKYSLPAIKVVIPNPYGELENEDRLLPVFSKKIKKGEEVQLREAEVVRNNIKAKDLAQYYLDAVQTPISSNDASGGFFSLEMKPLGFRETQKQFVFRALAEEPYSLDIREINRLVKVVA